MVNVCPRAQGPVFHRSPVHLEQDSSVLPGPVDPSPWRALQVPLRLPVSPSPSRALRAQLGAVFLGMKAKSETLCSKPEGSCPRLQAVSHTPAPGRPPRGLGKWATPSGATACYGISQPALCRLAGCSQESQWGEPHVSLLPWRPTECCRSLCCDAKPELAVTP